MVGLVYAVKRVPTIVVIRIAHKRLVVDMEFVTPLVLIGCANANILAKAGWQNCKPTVYFLF